MTLHLYYSFVFLAWLFRAASWPAVVVSIVGAGAFLLLAYAKEMEQRREVRQLAMRVEQLTNPSIVEIKMPQSTSTTQAEMQKRLARMARLN